MNSTVLVVEDDALILSVIVEILTLEGYRVHTAMNGRDALVCASAQTPDLVLSDIGLPFVDGHAVALAMRERGIPIILMSASSFSDPDFASVFLRKPFDLDSLVDMVDRLLVESKRCSGHRGKLSSRFNCVFRNWVAHSSRSSRTAMVL